MRLSKHQINLALDAYEKNRKIDSVRTSTNIAGSEYEHKSAIKASLYAVLKKHCTESQINRASMDYKAKRSIFRWDGMSPWGLAGTKNHREAIKSSFGSLKT